MKRDYKTNAEWKKAYKEKQDLLEENYVEVSPYKFYREMFPEGSFQQVGEQRDSKANGIVTTKIEEKSGRRFINISIMTDDLEAIDKFVPPKRRPKYETTQKLALIAPGSFYGQHKSKLMMHELYAIVIDIDYVGKQQLKNLIKQFKNGSHAIPPTYIVSSGRGVHLYYFLETPLPMYKYYEEQLSALKKDLIRWSWNETTSIKPLEKDMAGVSQAFRAVGSETKLGIDYLTRAYRVTGQRYTVEQIKDWIQSDVDVSMESQRTAYRKKHIPLEKAKKLYPKWYQERIVEGKPKNENAKWTCKRALYDWWLKKCRTEAKVGGRYYCIMALAAYGSKCDIPEKEIKADAISLLEHMESITDDEKNHFTKQDIEDALKAYKKKDVNLTFKLTRGHIEETTKIEIPKNKRNGRTRVKHQEYRRLQKQVKIMMGEADDWDKGGRPEKSKIVVEWRKQNPDGKKIDCERDTGLSRHTVLKWWDCK